MIPAGPASAELLAVCRSRNRDRPRLRSLEDQAGVRNHHHVSADQKIAAHSFRHVAENSFMIAGCISAIAASRPELTIIPPRRQRGSMCLSSIPLLRGMSEKDKFSHIIMHRSGPIPIRGRETIHGRDD